MKRCNACGQILSQKITTCPACGSRTMAGIKRIDDYRITSIIHEGRSTMVCRAVKEGSNTPVSIRLFTKTSGVDDTVAERLKKELIELQKLPPEHFVQHFKLVQSRDGLWYRVSEWVNAANWGSVFVSGVLNDPHRIVTLFHNIASVLSLLHKRDHFMPYLILDDILIPKAHTHDLRVKINYKLSRFLNARATHHGPMLQKLLDCHPDIINQRPIDFRSAVWSLGKVFVELLTANPNITNFSEKIDTLEGIHPDLAVLIKVMLSDDPDLRPQTMENVVTALAGILDRMPHSNQTQATPAEKKKILLSELKWFRRVVVILLFVIAGMTAFGTVSWFYMKKEPNDSETTLTRFIESYAGSIAFLMVEYWFKSDTGDIVYKNKVEGTAFLVDPEGYLLTNRHVACPWLEDTSLFQAYAQSVALKKKVHFNYRMYLWFEGEKAFNRLPDLSNSIELSDSYHLASAYSSDGPGNLRIAGVPRTSVKTGERIKSPFKNDFAILKIDNPPPGLKPLPLDASFRSAEIQRLSPVIILGFPLGNRTLYDHINTSITRGHVRRTTKEIIQVDSSIYKGNSGGPAINSRGQVIGIASGVVTDQTSGYFKVSTPLSDFGLILPISRPAAFVSAIKAGQPHWDGILDFTLDVKLKQIFQLAVENNFAEARDLTKQMLEKRSDPVLLFAAGMLNFCTRQFDRSKLYFKQLSMIEQDNTTARLMLYIIDWISGQEKSTRLTAPLFTMAWHDENEFLGYLARVLRDGKRYSGQFLDFENRPEQSWRLFIEGLIAEKKNEFEHAQAMFKQSILNAGVNDWVYFLSFSRLSQVQKRLTMDLEDKKEHLEKAESFQTKAVEYRDAAEKRRTAITALINEFESDKSSREKKIEIYRALMKQAPENRTITGRIAFFHATLGDWEEAARFTDAYFKKPGRETSLSLSLGLLKGGILHLEGRYSESIAYLTHFSNTTTAPWYRTISRHLTSKSGDEDLIKLAGNKPEKLITLHTALGLWAEADKNPQKAVHHYREALSSYLDDWNEYDLALGRLILLRQAAN